MGGFDDKLEIPSGGGRLELNVLGCGFVGELNRRDRTPPLGGIIAEIDLAVRRPAEWLVLPGHAGDAFDSPGAPKIDCQKVWERCGWLPCVVPERALVAIDG